MKLLVTAWIIPAMVWQVHVTFAQSTGYTGTAACLTCHSTFKPVAKDYMQTLHAKIHQAPTAQSIVGDFTKTVSMGTAFGGASVELRIGQDGWYAKLVPSSGTARELKVEYTYGGAWKQRYLVRMENNLYILPIQWNNVKYLDYTSGAWITYNPQNWFRSDGTLLPLTNAFRRTSYDKNCAGCHVTGLSVAKSVTGTDTTWLASWANSSATVDMIVGCENCHGPGAAHVAAPTDQNIKNPAIFTPKARRLETCGQCHFRGTSSAGTFEYPWDETNNKSYVEYLGAAELASFMMLGPGVWVDGVTPRQHHQQYNDMLISKHFTTPYMDITCTTCHDPHQNTTNAYQLVTTLTVGTDQFTVKNEDNTLCLACHAAQGSFAGITKDMVKDPVTNRTAIAAVVSAHTHHGYSPEQYGNSRCTSCHMTRTAISAIAYDIKTHDFGVIPPSMTILYKDRLTPTKGMTNSCAYPCHRNATGNRGLGVGTDATLTDWTEATDLALADTLNRAWEKWFGSTSVVQTGITPAAFDLAQNFPNPFAPATTIEYALPRHASVSLKVYDSEGRLVRTLVDAQQFAGTFRVPFDAGTLPAGVYFYRLTAGSASITKKMALLR